MHGRNSWSCDNIGYRGPAPPEGHGPHRYRLRLYALDEKLEIPAGCDAHELRCAMAGHVLEQAELAGVYER